MCTVGKKLFSPIFALNRRNSRISYFLKYRWLSTDIKNHSISSENEENDDFFGFIRGDGVTDVVVGEKNEKSVDVFAKYERIVRKPKSEKLFITNFGSIRYDADNKPEYHGQFAPVDADNEETEREDQKHEENVAKNFLKKRLKRVEEKLNLEKKIVVNYDRETSVSSFEEGIQKQNYFDEVCFGEFSAKQQPTPEIQEKRLSDVTKTEDENYVDQMYFSNLIESENKTKIEQKEKISPVVAKKAAKLKKEIDTADENYADERKSFHTSAEKTTTTKLSPIEKNNYIDEIYFGNAEVSEKEVKNEGESKFSTASLNEENEDVFSNQITPDKSPLRQIKDENKLPEKKPRRKLMEDYSPKTDSDSDKLQRKTQKLKPKEQATEKIEEKRQNSKFKFSTEQQQQQQQQQDPIPNVKKPTTAFDLVSKVKQEEDNKAIEEGRVVPQMIDLNTQPEHVVLEMLKESIIYNQNDIVALNKPYGLTSQSGKKNHHCIQRYLSDLARFIDRDLTTLHVVHRLDKGTTGVLLLAKTERMSNLLKSWFRTRTLQKTYWAITRGVPDPPEGIINIPIAEGKIGDRRRMVLKPDYNEVSKIVIKKSSVSTQEAITEYQVLCQNGNAALVQLQSKTGVTHQLRVHLGFGLGCPILGDHKYSCTDRLVPQRLPGDLLQRLKIRQSKVRDLPIHLHARSVVIPEVTEGRNIFIRAELPKHFRWAMQKLKINTK